MQVGEKKKKKTYKHENHSNLSDCWELRLQRYIAVVDMVEYSGLTSALLSMLSSPCSLLSLASLAHQSVVASKVWGPNKTKNMTNHRTKPVEYHVPRGPMMTPQK